MSSNLSPIDTAKFVAAKRAVDFVEDGMRVGLGTGSTAAWASSSRRAATVRPSAISARNAATAVRP